MSTAFFSQSFKPQVLSRQEGFHLPSPDPPSPPQNSATNGVHNQAPGSAPFDPHLFMPPFLSIPDPFRKFPAADAHSPLDFSDELASLIGSAPSPTHTSHTSHSHSHSHSQSSHHAQSHERSTQSPAYDEYRPPPHNIFDISAPTPHHSHGYGAAGAHAYSLPPASAMHTHGLQDFATHAHFNSTLPALGSSMRYEPPPAPAGADPSSASSFSSHLSSLSPLSTFPDFHIPSTAACRTPSPSTPAHAHHPDSFSRSRSRSRPPTASTQEPPSTNGGPARRTRAKRGSVSSTSPPPLHRGHTQPLVIPGGVGGLSARAPASPLGLHSATAPSGTGWFLPGPGEFLPTPDSVHGGFSAFTGPGSLGSVGAATALGVSPKDSPIAENAPAPGDVSTKQALLANEKRRRRRESHNAVERRRRDNINEKISELATLIPECLLDPNATLTMPASLSASGEDLLFGGPKLPKDPAPKDPAIKDAKEAKDAVITKESKDEKDGSAEPEEGTGSGEGAVVKANKGMILRKSVEYIRYLQQLVSAQASRNRDLEQQLSVFRASGSASGAGVDDMGTLMLHEEVDAFGFFASPLSGPLTDAGANANGLGVNGINGSAVKGASRAMHRGALERVDETQMEVDGDGDEDEDSAMAMAVDGEPARDPRASLPSPDPDPEEDAMEEVRGRRGRDGRPVGVNGVMKTEGDMES